MQHPENDDTQAHLNALMDEIRSEAAQTAFWTGRDHFSARVLSAMAHVPRHEFTPELLPPQEAYANQPQPIGHGQTISQPYIVALMTDLLDLNDDARVLEIGTGCGYQTAVLAQVAGTVYSIECLKPLADMATATLAGLGYTNTSVQCGDGTLGWAEYAPYDGILVTACHDGPIPTALIEQLRPGGRMIIPLGPRWGPQMLHVGVKDAAGNFTHNPILPVAFVPLVSRLERR